MKDKNKLLKNKTQFKDILEENTINYKGKHENTIKQCPKIYELLCKLLDSETIESKDKSQISSAIAYFILPKDIFPEELFGAKGYIDDIYLSLYILKKIEQKYEIEELLENWNYDCKLLINLLNKEYQMLNKEYNYILKDMLEYIGLK